MLQLIYIRMRVVSQSRCIDYEIRKTASSDRTSNDLFSMLSK